MRIVPRSGGRGPAPDAVKGGAAARKGERGERAPSGGDWGRSLPSQVGAAACPKRRATPGRPDGVGLPGTTHHANELTRSEIHFGTQ